MPIPNSVPDAILIRYCNQCYRLAELHVHSRGAYRTVVRGGIRCGIPNDGPIRCRGLLAIRPREMRAMMNAEKMRRENIGRWEFIDEGTSSYSAIDPERVVRVDREEALRQARATAQDIQFFNESQRQWLSTHPVPPAGRVRSPLLPNSDFEWQDAGELPPSNRRRR